MEFADERKYIRWVLQKLPAFLIGVYYLIAITGVTAWPVLHVIKFIVLIGLPLTVSL